MKREEKVQVEFTRYFTKDGTPTCAIDFTTGKVCIFYRTKSFGTKELCCFVPPIQQDNQPNEDDDPIPRSSPKHSMPALIQLSRTKNGLGSLIPHEDCPMFGGGSSSEKQQPT